MRFQVTVNGTYETRLTRGTPGEVGSKSYVFGVETGEETIVDVKKDSYVESTYLTSTNACKQVCADDSGPNLYTSKVTFEDDDKASGVSTKFTLKLRSEPMGCITCFGSNIPCLFLFPPLCIQISLLMCCALVCCGNQEAQWSAGRQMAQRTANFAKSMLFKGFTNPKDSNLMMMMNPFAMMGGLPGAMNGMFGAQAQQHHMQRMQQGGSLFGAQQQMQMQMQMMQMQGQMGGNMTTTVPVATATAVPVQTVTTTAVPVEPITTTAVPTTTDVDVGSAPPKQDM